MQRFFPIFFCCSVYRQGKRKKGFKKIKIFLKPFSNLFLKQHPHMVYNKSSDPRDHTLADHHSRRPFSAELPFHRSNRSHTGRIEKAEHQKRRRAGHTQASLQKSRASEQYGERRHHALFCQKTGDQRRHDAPVPKAHGQEERRQHTGCQSENAVLGIRYHVQSHVKILQEPDDNGCHKNHRKRPLKEVLCLFPQKMQHVFCPRHPVIGKLHDKGTASPLNMVFLNKSAIRIAMTIPST